MRDGRRFTIRCRVEDRDIEFYLGQIVTIEDTEGLGVVFSITHFLNGEPSIGVQALVRKDEGDFGLLPERAWRIQSRVTPYEDAKSGDYFLGVDQKTGKCKIYRCHCSEWKKANEAREAVAAMKKVTSDV